MKPSNSDITRLLFQSAMRLILPVVAFIYLAAVWFDSVKDSWVVKGLGRPLAFFTQEAGLFPRAVLYAHDYRAEGWSCRDHRWFELDISADFPMEADNKENRFSRLLYFYDQDRPTMQALEKFLVARNNQRSLDAAAAGQGSPPPLIGGIRAVNLRLPLGTPGERGERYTRLPLDAYPEDVRKNLYYTPESRLKEQCKKLVP